METKIAVLRTCNSEEYGSLCFDMFQQYIDAMKSPHLALTEFNIVEASYPKQIDTFQSYVIMGSFANAYDNDPWIYTLMEFIRKLKEKCIKTVGICFGHQIIARALGGSVSIMPSGPFYGEKAVNFDLTCFNRGSKPITQLFTHNDAVYSLPPNSKSLTNGGETCPSFLVLDAEEKPIMLTFQAHPEYFTDTGKKSVELQAANLSQVNRQRLLQGLETTEKDSEIRDLILEFLTS